MWETILGLGIGFIVLLAVIWWLPIIFILTSDKTTGGEKILWLIGVLFVSWFAWILYMFLAPLAPKEQ